MNNLLHKNGKSVALYDMVLLLLLLLLFTAIEFPLSGISPYASNK